MRLARLLLSHGAVACALCLLLVAGNSWEGSPLRTAEWRVFDRLLRLTPGTGASPVVFVEIGEESLGRVGSWPWPRALVAEGTRRLLAGGARAVGLCLRYPGPELNPGLEEVHALLRPAEGDGADPVPGEITRTVLAAAAERLDGDTVFAEVGSAAPLVLPVFWGKGSARTRSPAAADLLRPFLLDLPPALRDWRVRLAALQNPFQRPLSALSPNALEPPYPRLLGGSVALGHDGWFPDADGVVRHATLLLPTGEGYLPSLALQLAARASVPPAKLEVGEAGADSRVLRLGSVPLPADENFRLLLDGRARLERVEFGQVLQGEVPPARVRDRVVLVGLSARGYGESYLLPDGGRATGAELSALAAANLLAARHPVRPSWAWALETGFLLYLGLFLAFLAPRLSLRAGGAAVVLFLLAWGGAGAYLGGTRGIWLQTLSPLLLGVSGFGLLALRRLAAAGESRGEAVELNRMLGLSFQSQGQLDLAFERLARCPVRDPSVRELLYNLGLDFERKRMLHKAVGVYRHILTGGGFRDARERIQRLEAPEGTLILGAGGTAGSSSLVPGPGGTAPTLGRYEIVRELGQGAMGTVYLGRDPTINREVAIKTLRFDEVTEAERPEVKRRFFREAEAAGKLSHPGIVTIHDAGEDHELAYLAMEYLEGRNLTAHCAKDHLLPVGQVLDIGASVAEALDYAHRHGVVHRDVKPANIMLGPDGKVKVTDFGIARVLTSTSTRTGVILGTPSYMSPEQVAGRKVDGRSDLFSLGVVLYELLSGERPFGGENLTALMYQITKGEYAPLGEVRRGLPKCSVAVVDQLLARAVSRRIKSAAEVADQLRTCRKTLR